MQYPILIDALEAFGARLATTLTTLIKSFAMSRCPKKNTFGHGAAQTRRQL
jgi:hypothetical protein